MAIRYVEKPKSQSAVVDYKSPTTKRLYSFWGSSDKNEILLAVALVMPQFDSTIDATTGAVISLFPQKVDCDPFSQDTWDVTVHYGNSSDTVDVTFSLGVQSVKIFESLANVNVYDCIDGGIDTDQTEPYWGTTIGLNTDGEVEGCEIEVGKVEFCITRKWQTGQLDPNYVKLLADFTDRTAVNDDLFTFNWLGQAFNFTRGTLRIRGAPLKWDGTGQLEISYHFAYSRAIGPPTGSPGAWSATTTYAAGDKVILNSGVWQSVAGANLNNAPHQYDAWSWIFQYQFGDKVRNGTHEYESTVNNNLTNPGDPFSDWTDLGVIKWTYLGWAQTYDIFTIGNSDPITKEGWQYGEVRYKVTTVAGVKTTTPLCYIVHDVYPHKDFGELQL